MPLFNALAALLSKTIPAFTKLPRLRIYLQLDACLQTRVGWVRLSEQEGWHANCGKNRPRFS